MENLLDFLTALCAGCSVGCIAFYIIRALSGIELERKTSFEKPIPILFKLLYPFLAVGKRMAGGKGFSTWHQTAETKLAMAGYSNVLTPADFVGLRLLFILVGVIIAFLGVFSKQPMACIIVGLLLSFYPSVWINTVIKKRHTSIMRALPNVLDLLTLSVESGRDLVTSLRDIINRRPMDDLGEELLFTFQEIQLGRKRSDALRGMAKRVRQVDLTATLNSIVQAEELGVSIAQLLRIQGDTQRAKRFAMAEKQANEAPVKIIIPVVLFILPAVFIILMGPLIKMTLDQMR
ncbi:MAG: type II secretion system F family protein [Lentisphaeria bacterium]|nr:type II secretion system F family protein [Lentisphaeria bacterium]